MQEQHDHHGNSVAAWTGVIVILVGFTIMAAGVGFTSVALFIVGTVVAVLGVVAGKVMAMAGYGVDGKHVPADQSDA
jgi:multisubunit Na+/H+ antiporter MnhG subunit